MRFSRRGCVRRTYLTPYPEPPLPSLPRPPVLSTEQCPPSSQLQSPFFSLAPELREIILREAFGDRTIHVDLRSRRGMHSMVTRNTRPLRNPFTPVREGWRRLVPGGGAKSPEPEGHDRDVPLWRWYSCFCHRDCPDRVMPRDVTVIGPDIERVFFGDGCWRGRRWCCGDREAGAPPEGYYVGVMGFLLSCKRAYQELLPVLYATNTISIESQPLIQGLMRQSVVPGAPRVTGQGMQLVTSLQLTSTLVLWHYYMRWRQVEDRALFVEQLDLLPQAFPHLQRLEWIFRGDVYSGRYGPFMILTEEFAEAEELILRPMLQACAKMSALQELTVGLPENLFWAAMVVERRKLGSCQDFIGQQLGKIRMWYPFTERPGGRGAERVGCWLAYGEDEDREWRFDGTARRSLVPLFTSANERSAAWN